MRGVALTLASTAPLTCRVQLLVPTEFPEDIARAIGAPITASADATGRSFAATFVEPLELVVAARRLVAPLAVRTSGYLSRATVRGFAAAPLALELLRDAAEPMRGAWLWLLQQLAIAEPPAIDTALVAAIGAVPKPVASLDPSFIALAVLERGYRNGTEVTQFFDRDEVIVSRREELADIWLPDIFIARRHCGFMRRDGVWSIHDLASSGGIFYQSCRIAAPFALCPGDIIELGNHSIEVVAIL